METRRVLRICASTVGLLVLAGSIAGPPSSASAPTTVPAVTEAVAADAASVSAPAVRSVEAESPSGRAPNPPRAEAARSGARRGADPARPRRGNGADRGCPPDPHPCGGEWPAELAGRDDFVLDRIEEVRVVAGDGIALHGWVVLPKVPAGVEVPTVLSSSPYYNAVAGGTVYRDPTTPVDVPAVGAAGWLSDAEPPAFDVETHSAGFPPVRLLRRGYALAYFSLRGTGKSEGCFDGGGALDEADQVAIIDDLARRPWSNGRVGMVGLSAPARASWQAAVAAPAALKTIVTAGDFIDLYQWVHTPQGSNSLLTSGYYTQWTANLTITGGLLAGDTGIVDRTGCEPARFGTVLARGLATGDRDAEYYAQRSVAQRLGAVRAAVLDTSGYLDLAGHYGQDSTIWGSLPPDTPRVAIRGYWGHDHPTPWNAWGTRLDFPSGTVDWERFVIRWLDHWLKGIGPAPRTGVVHHQDQNLDWHEATSWSPSPDTKEVLYLSGTGLTPEPAAGDITFRSAPHPLEADWAEEMADSLTGRGIGRPHEQGLNPTLCPTVLDERLSHAYRTSPTSSPVLIAGNPFAYLDVSSDQPGGVVTVSLYDIEPASSCSGPHVTGARYIASGSADLNFHRTPYLAHDFPVDTPTRVRVDLSDTTYVLGAGHRLAVVVSNGGPYERAGSTFTPNITIHGSRGPRGALASHVVVPVAQGSLGGPRPTARYPQRPFTTSGYRD